ncbi:exodeoxyribonuclease VII large subunit [Bacterioplanoides sp. SCSIO 12839]|uniref:exodeoxyribonuclease VII large subunit n=1 Tax=Bacterioplanoides sp. SCSIO 12839 TaxID=2829569 RepID=UPI002107FAE0|nr:exodeoxyribonuclease VII large subunit [Bacterioplanoides sp. SCSIO 12839]UTW47069.1 exodeoxyribonuclease VII large subunit [Bacterioplanoides sp. SCSIO 12839]
MSVPSNAVFTVSQLNQRAKQLLEISFAAVRVEGEISNLSRPSSGHWYFTLKDQGAQVRCAMFRSRVAGIRFGVKEGDKVELRAKVSLYENRGDYQLIVDAMKPAGEGALQLAYEQLKSRLAAEGLFAQEVKKPVQPVNRVAVITSPTGAAVHDMLTVFKRRNPSVRIDIYPTQVQGKEATPQIVAAIERANRDAVQNQQNGPQAIIVGRGGGSLEDLWCFNEEAVARAIFHSQLPVVSAVGHETDVTIADFVADVRAPTPSAAAELLSSDRSLSQNQYLQLKQRLLQATRTHLQQQQQKLHYLFSRLRTPQQQLQSAAQRLDQFELRLQAVWQNQQRQRSHQLENLNQRVAHQHPVRQLNNYQNQLSNLEKQLQQTIQQRLNSAQQALQQQVQLLQSLSPLEVLARGYSLTQHPNGHVIDDANQVSSGDRIQTRLHQGWLECEVVETYSSDTGGGDAGGIPTEND